MACIYTYKGKQYSESEIKDIVFKEEVNPADIKFATLEDLANLLAYTNSKIILPGSRVEYTTPDNMKFKTYAEASNHISQLVKSIEEVDLSEVKIEKKTLAGEIDPITGKKIKSAKFKWGSLPYFSSDDNQYEPGEPDSFELVFEDDTEYTVYSNDLFRYYDEETRQFYDQIRPSGNSIESFIESNKEYEQSKEVIEEWKKVNGIQYNPEEIYSRGQGFYSSIGAYSTLELDLLLQNLLQHIEDNKKAGGKFAISAFTKPVDKRIMHLEKESSVRFVIYPQSEDILWAAPTDVYSGSVWDASEKVSKAKKSELLGVSYTKAPSLENVGLVSPNLASIIDERSHQHNELGIELTTTNFRLEYDDSVPYEIKKLVNAVNSILDSRYGKIVKPEIVKPNDKKTFAVKHIFGNVIKEFNSYEDAKKFKEQKEKEDYKSPEVDEDGFPLDDSYMRDLYEIKTYIKIEGVQPTQTRENTTSIESVKSKVLSTDNRPKSLEELQEGDGFLYYESNGKYFKEDLSKQIDIEITKEEYEGKKEYTEQALINTKIAILKEVPKKYPRSLITSRVINSDTSPRQYQRSGNVEATQIQQTPQISVPNELQNLILSGLQDRSNKRSGIDTSILSDGEQVLWGSLNLDDSGSARVFSTSMETVPVGYSDTLRARTAGRNFNEVWNSTEFSQVEREQILFASLVERLSKSPNSFNGKLYGYIKEKFGQLERGKSKESGIRFIDQADLPPLFASNGHIYVNRSFYQYINSLNINNLDEYLEISLSEELIHLVTDNLMTNEDYLQVLSEIPTNVRQKIQTLYPSVNFEDPVNSLTLIDEYLRMLIQDSIFGKTTEIVKNQSSTGLSLIERAWNFIKDFLASNYSQAPITSSVVNKSLAFISESLNKPNTNPILQGNQQEQVKKFAELQERLSNKEFIEGAKNAYESTPELQQFGTQEQYNDYIARVSLGIIKNPSSGEYNYTSKVKDIVYHGSSDKIEKFDTSKSKVSNVIYFSKEIEEARHYSKKRQGRAFIIDNYKYSSFTDSEGNPFYVKKDIKKEDEKFKNVDDLKKYEISKEEYQSAYSKLGHLNPSLLNINKLYNGVGEDLFFGVGSELKEEGFDGLITTNDEGMDSILAVFEPEQIHILGSKQDVEGFKKWIENNPKSQSKSPTYYQLSAEQTELQKVDVSLKNKLLNINKEPLSREDTTYLYSILDPKYKQKLLAKGITDFHSFINTPTKDTLYQKIVNFFYNLFNIYTTNKVINDFINTNKKEVLTPQGEMLLRGITTNQSSRMPVINRLLYRGIIPGNYNKKNIYNAILENLLKQRDYEYFIKTINKWNKNNVSIEENIAVPTWTLNITEAQYKKREDAWRLSNGLPQVNNTFKYIGKNEKGEDIYDFVDPSFNLEDESEILKGIDKTNAVMGKYAVKKGKDNIGHFIQYSDRWDLDLSGFVRTIVDFTQKPFVVTGKIYRALSYDNEGYSEIYLTLDSSDKNIRSFNEFQEQLEEQDLIYTEDVSDAVLSQPITYLDANYQTTQTEVEEAPATTLTTEVREKLLAFAKKAGIKIEVLANLLATKGANGLADIKNMLIQLQQGREDFALAEEVAHFFVEGLDPNSKLYQDMMQLAPYTRLYQLVASEYGDVYHGDKEMLKKETMGKLISLYLTDKQQFEYWVAPASTTLFQRVVEWIRSFLKITNRTPKYKAFIRAAEEILDLKTEGLNWNANTEMVFFNKVSSKQFVTLGGKELPQDKKIMINVNDTIFDYQNFTFGDNNVDRKKKMAGNTQDLLTYYNNVQLTPFAKELIDKIKAGVINVDNIEFYTSLTITDALKTRLNTIIGKSVTVHNSNPIVEYETEDGDPMINIKTTKEFLSEFLDAFIIDNTTTVVDPNRADFHLYSKAIKYTPAAEKARAENIRRGREIAAAQFELLGNGVLSNLIIQAHIKLFSGGGLKKAVEYMETALGKISDEEVINLFKDSQGRIVIPLDSASRAKELIKKSEKTSEAIMQFIGTLEGITNFYNIILENAKKIDTENMTDEQVDALIFEMNKVANISEYWLSYTEEILEELRMKTGVQEATNVVSRVKTSIEQAQNEVLEKSRAVVAKKLNKQIENYNYGINARIQDIEKMIKEGQTSKGTKLSARDIEELEKEKTNLEEKHKMSAEKIINILTGREKDINAITTWIKTLPNTGDPIIASVGKMLRIVEQETQVNTLVQTQQFAQDMNDLMKKYNLTQDDIEEFLITQETYRYFNPETQQYENKQRMAFLNPFKDRHVFVEKMSELNEARKAWYNSIKTGEDLELKEAYFKLKKEFEKFKLEHWNQDYTEEYYTRYNKIKEDFGEDLFEEAMEKVSGIYEDIAVIEDGIIDETVDDEEQAYKTISDLRRELGFLKMTVNQDGTQKEDKDVRIAQLLQRKAEIDSEIFDYEINHKKFQEAVLSLINSYVIEDGLRSQIEEALNAKNYSRVQTLASTLDPKVSAWFELNTINKPGQKFYEDRNKITDRLNELFIELDKLRGKQSDTTVKDLWKEIFTLSRPYRDEDGNITATAIPLALQRKITEFNQMIENYRRAAEQDLKNLSNEDKIKLSKLRKEIKEQVKLLREIQKKEETDEYHEEFENRANASPLFSSFSESYANLKTAAKYFVEKNPDDPFSEWFLANHYVGVQTDILEGETEVYYSSYIWTKVEPIDSSLIEVIPTIKFGKRIIKEEYVTPKIDFVTWSPVTQRWLPKSDTYKNPAYEELRKKATVAGSKEEGLMEFLTRLTAFHLETQINSVTRSRLEWFIPSVPKRTLEGNIITDSYAKFVDRGSTFEEGESNFEEDQNVVPTAKQKLKQFMSRISSYIDSGQWKPAESVKFDERSGQYVEVKREIPVMYTGYMEPQDISKDVLMSSVLFRESVNKANELRNNLPTVNLLEKILANTPNQKNRAEAIKFMKENKFHGVNKQYEVGKGLDNFLRHMRKLYRVGSQSDVFGFFNTIKNSFQGRLQNYINAEFYGWSSGRAMRKAAAYHKNNLWYFLGESEKPLAERSKDWFLQAFINPGSFDKLLLYTQPGAMKKFSSDNFLFLSTATFEYAISVNALYSHLFHKELSRTSPSGEKEVKKLYDIITIKDNQPYIDPAEGWVDETGKPIDSSYLIRMKTQLTSILEYTQGKTAEMTKLNTTTIGTAILFFKSWVIPSLRRRFDLKKANYVLDRDLEGYWITFARLTLKMLLNLKAYGESNWNTFSEEDKANYFTALREISVMLASTLIIALGFGFDPDDEDKYKKVAEMDFLSQTALLIAVQTKLETEGLSPVPGLKLEGGIIPPILTEAPKYFTNPVIGMPIISDTFKLIDNLMKLLTGSESAYYDRNMPQYNIEKGESKAYHFFFKIAQLDDLMYTWDNPEGRLQVLVGMAKR